MAVLQKIRNKGVLLVSIIAIALFLFVIGDLLRGGEGLINQSRQTVGEINGEGISIQDYQDLYQEFQTYEEITQQNTSREDDSRIRDIAWNTFVQNQLIGKECAALGIAVTDEEVAQVIRTGASQLLQVPVFMNQQGQYDYAQLSNFLSEYKKLKDSGQQLPEAYEKIYNYYLFAQKQIRNQYLASKYQNLLAKCLLSNPVEARQAYEGRTDESNVVLVSVPFTTVSDDQVSVSDDDIKNKYNANKAQFQQLVETRDAKVIDIAITASEADKKAMEKDMDEASRTLAAATTHDQASAAVRQATSLLSYSDVFKTVDAFPQMIAARLDGDSTAIAVGQTTAPAYDAVTNTYYTVKLLDKTTQPDSVLYRQLAVIGKDEKDTDTKADSILQALNAGFDFKALAKKYNQTGDSLWISSAQYQNATLDADNASFINTLYDMAAGQTRKLKLSNGNSVILTVLESRHPVTKYNVAAVVKEMRFSDDTYSQEYNKFSSFVAANPTLEKMEANAAKNGYTVRPLTGISSASHNIAGVHNTQDALRWLFDTAKTGDVSQLYECGDNDHLLIVALTGINKTGTAPLDKVRDMLRQQLLNDKKAEKIIAGCKNVKTLAAAQKIQGAVTDTVSHVTFSAPAFVRATTTSEPVVSALAAKTPQGAFAGPVKGNSGVYMLQVLQKSKTAGKFDEKAEETQASQMSFRYLSQNIISDLYLKAKVKDLRYKFF